MIIPPNKDVSAWHYLGNEMFGNKITIRKYWWQAEDQNWYLKPWHTGLPEGLSLSTPLIHAGWQYLEPCDELDPEMIT